LNKVSLKIIINMALINYVKKEEATGQIADIYTMIENKMHVVPNAIQFHSASPEFFGKIMNVFNHFSEHPSLDPVSVAYIRMLISNIAGGEYCVRFQSKLLLYMKVTQEAIEQAKGDYNLIQLDEKRKSLVCFVLDEMFDKMDNAEQRINELRKLGWADKDIYEASIIGALQKGMVQLLKTFKVEIDF